jgi:hypothetical protein
MFTKQNLLAAFAGSVTLFLLGWISSSLYGKWAAGNYTPISGLKFGSWFGLFVGTGLGLVQMGTSHLMDTPGHLAEAVLELVYHAIVGLVIALVYRKTAAPSS